MAKLLDVDLPIELIKKLSRVNQVDSWGPQILKEGGAAFAEELKKELVKHRDTGELITSIEPQKPKYNAKKGVWEASIYNPKAPTSGARNAMKLAELEYGNSRQKETPVIAFAKERTIPRMRTAANKIIARVVNGE